MPPSLSALERGSPPSRRRSCLSCTKSKRRCDNSLPSCLRCSRRGIACSYPIKQICQHSKPSHPSDPPYAFLPVPSCDLVIDSSASPSTYLEDWQSLETVGMAIDFTTTESTAACLDLPIHEDPLPGLLPKSLMTEGSSLDLIPTPRMTLSAPVSAENWNYVSRIIASHLSYAIDTIKDAPRLLVTENRLPWSHPMLYRDQMPRSMQDALSSCALYLAKNSVNGPIILRSIDSRLHELLDAPEPTSPIESLARTQALLLYNIIGIFDGDINARETVASTQWALRRSTRKLLSFTKFGALGDAPHNDSLSLYSVSKTREVWESWVFMESSRRTFLIAVYFMHLYLVVMRTPPRTCDDRKYIGTSWTISSSLWHASNAVDFAQAWRQRKPHIVKVGDFSQLLAEGRAEDIDDFSKIFLSSLMGIDEFKIWMGTRGGTMSNARL